MNKKTKNSIVVFLDVDGVLNTEKTCVLTPNGYIGVDEARIVLLSNSIKAIAADGVILTTTWKNMKADAEDYIYLIESLEKHGVKVLGKTTEERVTQREEGILKYLELHPEIVEFVILDDQQFGFKNYSKLWESFIDTYGMGIENSNAASNTPSVAAILFLDAIKMHAKD